MLPGFIVRSEGYKGLFILGRGDRDAWKAPRSPVLQCFSESSQKVVETLHRESLILPVPSDQCSNDPLLVRPLQLSNIAIYISQLC